MGNSYSQSKKLKDLGVDFIQNKHWYMVRNNQLRTLKQQFKNDKITCDDVIVQSSGHTILHQSIVLDRKDIFKFCVVYGASWNKKDNLGITPLMKAAGLRRQYYVKQLLRMGADPNITDNDNRTAKDYANLYENFQITQILQGTSTQ